MTGPTINRHRSKQDYSTPKIFIEAVEKRFGKLVWDLAATEDNAKAPKFITPEQDSLAHGWPVELGPYWLNPPFDNITPWAAKCAEKYLRGTILFLTPAAVGSNWFRDYVWGKAKVIALNGRIIFDGQVEPEGWQEKHPGKIWKPEVYPKDLILSVYNPTLTMCEGLDRPFEVWDWRGTEIRAL